MFWRKKDIIEQFNRSQMQISHREYEARQLMHQCGVAEGERDALRSENKELRETNRRLLDHIAGMSGAPIFTQSVPATADGTKPVSFNQTPRDFVEEAEELERKALRDHQNDLLQEFANRRAREMEEVPKESAA